MTARRSPTAESVIKAIEKLSPEERDKLEQWIVDSAWKALDEYTEAELEVVTTQRAVVKLAYIFTLAADILAQTTQKLLSQSIDHRDKLKKLRDAGLIGTRSPKADPLIREYRSQGMSYGTIAKRLNAKGVKRRDGEEWTTASVNSYCNRHEIKPVK